MEKSLTAGELKTKALIEKEGYNVELSAQFGKYVVDLYLPELHVAVEYDGEGWHTFKKRDAARDNYLLEQHFLPVERITEKDYKNHLVLSRLRSFFDLWSTSAESRKRNHEDMLFDKLKETE